MAFARVFSVQPNFPASDRVSVEADLSRGLYAFSVVGLPDKAVEEARDRISAAIKHSGFTSPKSKNHKVVISLAPADVKKEGAVFDLPMALAYLLSAEEISFDPSKTLCIGELALDGSLRSVRGALPAALTARSAGFDTLIVPKENAAEAAFVDDITVYGADSLSAVVAHVVGKTALVAEPVPHVAALQNADIPAIDLADIKGQETAKRGLEIAAAGRHNVAFLGPPGTGKTMLATALSGILPPLTFDEAVEVTAIHSVAGALTEPLITHPPMRAPHHTSSYVALVGGGNAVRPGEVTLAHRGVLFLDEFPEFDRRALEALREPLENRAITVSRSAGSATYPANLMLVAAMNPPGDNADFRERARFARKVSAAIIDRIDLWIDVPNVPHEKLHAAAPSEVSATVRSRVIAARAAAAARAERLGIAAHMNSELPGKFLDTEMGITDDARDALAHAAQRMHFSPRAYHRVLRVARTIADLDGAAGVEAPHVLEALQYRPRLVQ